MEDAAALCTHLEQHAPTHLCAVCALRTAPCELQRVALEELPHKDLLLADGPSTSAAPRDALTRTTFAGVDSCLDPTAISGISAVAVQYGPTLHTCFNGVCGYCPNMVHEPSPLRFSGQCCYAWPLNNSTSYYATACKRLCHTRPMRFADGHAQVCNKCMADLRRQRLPAASLVCFDVGPMPAGFTPLTYVESLIVAVPASHAHPAPWRTGVARL